MNIDGFYTKDQVIEKFGLPTQYSSYESYEGYGMTFMYGNNWLQFSNDGEGTYFSGFSVNDSKFVTMTSLVDGGIKVGDDKAKLELLHMTINEPRDGVSEIWFEDWAIMSVRYNKDNKISHIGIIIID